MFVLPLSHPAVRRAAASPAFERSLDESLARIFSGSAPTKAADTTRTPAMDVTESDTAYSVVLDVPGVSKAQLKVSVEGRRVSIATTEAAPVEVEVTGEVPATQRTLYSERTAARYSRTVSLPAEVDQAASQAAFENGVLTLTLVKKVPTGATQLSIN